MVKFSNRANMAVIGVTGYHVTKGISRIGAQACKKALAKTGGVATAKTRATGIAALAAMGLTAGYTIKTVSKLHKDNKLADGYADRQRAAKEAKKKIQQSKSVSLTSKEKSRLNELQKRVNNIKSESEYSRFENTKAGQEYRNLVIKDIKSRK